MSVRIQTPAMYLWIIRAFSLLAPSESRAEWRREWEAEVINRWLLLEKWGKINAQTRFDLLTRIRGAWRDVLWFQQWRVRLLLVTFNMLVAVLSAFGALPELIVRGILNRQTQPFLLSLGGIIVTILFLTSGIAMLRQWRSARRFITATCLFSILLHVYGVLPPHRNMGYVALLVGAGYGPLMWLGFEWYNKRKLVS